jgi:hypothetical protein
MRRHFWHLYCEFSDMFRRNSNYKQLSELDAERRVSRMFVKLLRVSMFLFVAGFVCANYAANNYFGRHCEATAVSEKMERTVQYLWTCDNGQTYSW